jgi:hypothetical protein
MSTDADRKPATAARIYDYHLGGTHNFPADRAAAQAMLRMFPNAPLVMQENRAFLRRGVRYLAEAGIDQFLDVGSGIPTVGNVHEVAQSVNEKTRVVYVDIDPVAVAESLDILEGNEHVTAIRGDLRAAESIVDHPQVRRMLDFSRPVAVLMCAVLHLVHEDEKVRASLATLLGAVPSGSALLISHGIPENPDLDANDLEALQEIYRRQTATPLRPRTKAEVQALFGELEMVPPGLVWLPEWRPVPGEPTPLADAPPSSNAVGGIGLVR